MNDELQSFFKVTEVKTSARNIIPRRKPPVRPLPRLDNTRINWMKVHAFDYSGLEEFNDYWTGEMASRPIPFVSTDSKPLYAQQLLEKHINAVLNRLIPEMTPVVQPINKISSLGWPINGNPGTGINKKSGIKQYLSKFETVLDCFYRIQQGDLSEYIGAVNTIGPRLQAEVKDRELQFISPTGEIEQRTITAQDREIEVPELGLMTGSRTRTIVRPWVLNLYTQCWDSILHSVIMKHRLCDANVYTKYVWPSGSNFKTFDCKHYERYLGLAALSYAKAIGGKYTEYMNALIHSPYLVPATDWKHFFEITPIYREGVYPQFASGLSPVAPLGKLTNICAQVEYFRTSLNLSESQAVDVVLSGESEGLQRWMYGDDNRLLGSNSRIDPFIKFMSEVFEIEVDERPKYLGMVWRDDIRRFVLPAETYNTKLYLPERDFEFKKYPNLGLVERRHIFTEFGEPEIAQTIIPFEDALWAKAGHPFQEVQIAAVAEKRNASASGQQINKFEVTDKEYLMTPDEQIAAGVAWHIPRDQTSTIVRDLVGTDILDKLKFRDDPKTPIQPLNMPPSINLVEEGDIIENIPDET